MTPLERLQYYMGTALDISSKDLRPVSKVISELLPDILRGLRDVILDPSTSPSVRMQAIALAFSAWVRCLKADLQDERTEAIRSRAKAKHAEATAAKMTARAENKKSDLEIS